MNLHLKNVIIAAFPPCVIKRLMPKPVVPDIYTNPAYGVYGQTGEDLAIDAILGVRNTGFYIDVGANAPEYLSNTKRFYDRGWNGINLEPNPILYSSLAEARPRDINLNIGAGPKDGKMDFWRFAIDTLSTFDPKNASEAMLESKLIERKPVDIRKLSSIIEEYAPDKHIDFMSIDVEGFELSVLEGMDWKTQRPELVVMEVNPNGAGKMGAMKGYGYDLVFANGLNGFFIDRERMNDD